MEFVLILTGFFLFIASLWDLKSREVPDWLSFSLIAVGLGSSVLYALIFADWRILAYSVLGFLACWALGLLMFYSGQWGGGDAKLVMGLGSVLGLSWQGFPILVTFLLLTMVVGALYGLVYGFFLMAKHWALFKKGLKEFMASPKVVMGRRLVLVLALFLIVSALWLPFTLRFLMWSFVVLGLIGYY
ncbi:MAG: A24 family peptidase, partial [Nanoarchaeota archaeon]